DGMPGVVEVPVRGRDPTRGRHSAMKAGSRIRRQDVERRRFNAVLNRPFNRSLEHRLVVSVHAEYEAPVDHHAKIVKLANGIAVIPVEVLELALFTEISVIERLESYEQAAQSGGDGPFDQLRACYRRHGSSSLPQAAHATHPVKERSRETRRAQQVVVE